MNESIIINEKIRNLKWTECKSNKILSRPSFMKDFEPSQQFLSLALQGIMLSNAEVGFVENLQSIDPIFG